MGGYECFLPLVYGLTPKQFMLNYTFFYESFIFSKSVRNVGFELLDLAQIRSKLLKIELLRDFPLKSVRIVALHLLILSHSYGQKLYKKGLFLSQRADF